MSNRRGYRILEPDGSCHEYTTATNGLAPLGDRPYEEVEPVQVKDLGWGDVFYLFPTADATMRVCATWELLKAVVDGGRKILPSDNVGALRVLAHDEGPSAFHLLMMSGNHYVYRRLK